MYITLDILCRTRLVDEYWSASHYNHKCLLHNGLRLLGRLGTERVLVVISPFILLIAGTTTVTLKTLQPATRIPSATPSLPLPPNLTNLTNLFLFMPVSDAGMKELGKLNSLIELILFCPIDAGLTELAKLKNLKALGLDHPRVNDAGLKGIADLQQLTWLSLDSAKVTDFGLKELSNLNNLTTLTLTNLTETDASLKELAKCKQLTMIRIENELTEASKSELRIALPNCKILYGPR